MTDISSPARHVDRQRPLWRVVAIPTEHGGWGLTLEPVLLGLFLAFSWAGVAIGVAAFVAFVVRTPLKLALVDRRRHRSLPRTRLATRVAIVELVLLLALGLVALNGAGWAWLVPICIAAPLVAIELWFDIRSRSRRLIPELCGSIGITAVAAAIIVAGDETNRLALAASMILGGRAIASIPFVRTQIARLRHGHAVLTATNVFQVAGAVLAVTAIAVDERVTAGAVAVVVVAALQAGWMRRPTVPVAKIIGMQQMALGLAIVAATAIGVHLL